MAIAGLAVVAVGVVLILLGAFVTVVDWKDSRKKQEAKHPGLTGEALGLGDTIGALEKLLIELAKHPLGTRLIVLGMVCVLIGGILGGVAGLTA